MIEWERVPWTLWAYVLVSFVSVVGVLATAKTPLLGAILLVLLMGLWDFALLRGIRWVWLALVLLGVVGTLYDVVTGTGTWHGYLIGVAELVLLLLVPTRRFFERRPAVAVV